MMTRVQAIEELTNALINNDEEGFIRIIEGFIPTTAIVLYLLMVQDNKDDECLKKAHEWLLKRVGGKTANTLKR